MAHDITPRDSVQMILYCLRRRYLPQQGEILHAIDIPRQQKGPGICAGAFWLLQGLLSRSGSDPTNVLPGY